MTISAAQVKELRDLTGAGMMDCKAALNETNGNMEEAVEHIEFQMPGQSTKPKGRSAQTKSELQPVDDTGDWVSNYGTVETDAKVEGELVDGLMLNDAKCAGCGAQFHCHNASLPGFVLENLKKNI